MDQELEYCQCCYPNLVSATSPERRRALPLRRIWWRFKRHAWYARVLGPIGYLQRMFFNRASNRTTPGSSNEDAPSDHDLNLEVGEWVEVRSEKEIFATLDSQGKRGGLRFTPEMSKYCGKRFRVYKKVRKIIVEATGEKRSMQSPTVLLEGVICDGSAHEGCDRACFSFWREQWLKRSPK